MSRFRVSVFCGVLLAVVLLTVATMPVATATPAVTTGDESVVQDIDDGWVGPLTESDRPVESSVLGPADTSIAGAPVSSIAGAPVLSTVEAGDSTPIFAQHNDTALDSAPRQSSAHSGAARPASSESIVETITYRHLPERPGKIEVTVEYDLPESVAELDVRLSDVLEVNEVTGFEQIESDRYRWEDSADTHEPSVTFVMDARVEDEVRNGYNTYGTDKWALLQNPTDLDWSYYTSYPQPTLRTAYAFDGEGIGGSELAFVGEYEDHVTTVDGETIRLVVPEAADPAADPAAILETLERTSESLDVGGLNEETMVIVAPTGDVQWSASGIAWRNDAWALDTVSLTASSNTWIHEYVHLRQDHRAWRHAETEWLIEAQADYYAAQRNFEFEHIDYGTFVGQLEWGQSERFDDVVLADSSTWQSNNGDYINGALVVAAIDFEIREATNGAASFDDVFARMNDDESFGSGDPMDHEAFVELVEAIGGPDAAEVADHYATTTDAPETWNESTYNTVFHGAAPEMTYSLPAPPAERFEITGTYRETVLGEEPELVTGEALAVEVLVENDGTARGPYEVGLTVDGEVPGESAVVTGEIDPGASESVYPTVIFEEPGEYELDILGETTTVTVREPATLTVTNLELSAVQAEPGEPVMATATVANNETVPGDREITFAVDGTDWHTESVVLGPGETTEVQWEAQSSNPGEFVFSVDGIERLLQVGSVDLRVTDLGLSRETIEPGEPVTITATVTNVGSLSGERSIEILLGDEVVHERTVALDPDGQTQIETTVEDTESGTWTVTAGEHTLELEVTPSETMDDTGTDDTVTDDTRTDDDEAGDTGTDDARADDTSSDETGADDVGIEDGLPGFGVIPAIVGMVVGFFVLATRR